MKQYFILIFVASFPIIYADETFSTINSKKSLHKVNENFLSITVDPAAIVAGLNLSDNSLRLAQHLSPAYIRVAGPSTQFVKYVDNTKDHSSEETTNVVVTPSMWYGINEWLKLANLTPVFGINDAETAKGVWNPKATLPMLELSDKLNVSCFWQLGYDCSNKSEQQYKQDLNIFRHILDAFPERKDAWKIIGGDLSKCVSLENAKNTLEDLKGTVEAVMWEPTNSLDKIPKTSMKSPALWTTVPKTTTPISFTSALLWAKQIGEAAKSGYEVVFRQPRLHEMFADTPTFWVSLLHKKLMGISVLDIKTTPGSKNSSVFAHCTRKQNSFLRSGAMTVLIVNDGVEPYKTLIRVGNVHSKSTEVQSYILTSPDQFSTDVYLNNEKLTKKILEQSDISFTPKLRRARTNKALDLEVPAKSIGFFVFPGARLPVCINEEDGLNLLLEEIDEDQHEDIVHEIGERGSFGKQPTLKQIQFKMKQELQSDEKYYKRHVPKLAKSVDKEPPKRRISFDARNYFIKRAKLNDKYKQDKFSNKSPTLRMKQNPVVTTTMEKPIQKSVPVKSNNVNLQLSSYEVQTVLKNRAKSKAAKKNIIFTSEELDEIIKKASRKYPSKHKRDINMRLLNRKSLYQNQKDHVVKSPLQIREEFAQHLKSVKEKYRSKRDINLEALEKKAEGLEMKQETVKQTPKTKSDEKGVVMNESNQSSDELMDPLDSADYDDTPNRDALSENKKDIIHRMENFHKLKTQFKEKDTDDDVPILTKSDESEDLEGDFPCIHEYLGSDFNSDSVKEEFRELEEESKLKKMMNIKKKYPKVKLAKAKSKETKSDEDMDSDWFHSLFKRDLNVITKDDIKNYKKVMKKSLKDLKHMALEDRLKVDATEMNRKLSTLTEQNVLDDKEKKAIVKKVDSLNKKLEHNKKLSELLKKHLKHLDDSAEERRLLERNNKNSLMPSVQFVKRSTSVDERNIYKRSISDGVNSLENQIDGFMGDIENDVKFLHPKFAKKSGDFQLVLPNNKFEISENNGNTNIEYTHPDNKITKNSEIESSIDTETFKSAYRYDIVSTYKPSITGRKQSRSNIQRIPSREEEVMFKKLLNNLTGFFKSVGDKIKTCLDYLSI